MSKIILLAGGSGLVGARLSALLRSDGYTVRLLTRTPKAPNEFYWNPLKGELDPAALDLVDGIINLAGAGIAEKPWTKERKQEIIESRVLAATVLADALKAGNIRPETYISASAIGYYGNSGNRRMYESDKPVDDSFMADCCTQWEAAADTIALMGIRTVKFRIGIVLDTGGGALAEIIKPLRFGLGVYFADGKAWWSWVHIDDLCRMMMWALENPLEGIYNAVAPNPETGKSIVTQTAKAMNRPSLCLPAPEFALKLVLGEMSAVVLNSNLVSSEKIQGTGFKFQFPGLDEALADLFKRNQG